MNVHERLFKQWSMISKMVMDKARDPYKVADKLQGLLRVSVKNENVYQRLLKLWFTVFGVSDTEGKIRELSRVLQAIIDEPAAILKKNYLRRLMVMKLGAADGTETYDSVRAFFNAGFDPEFERSGIIFSGISTVTDITVDELVEDGKFKDFLGIDPEKLERRRVLGSQFIGFCRKYATKLGQGDSVTFFILTRKNEKVAEDLSNVFVAVVFVYHAGQFRARLYHFDRVRIWYSKFRPRVISP